MRKRTLEQLYGRLKPGERIPLLLAAEQRQDQTEYQQLFDASPIQNWYLPEHLMAELSLHVLTLTYVTQQLEAAGIVFFALFQMNQQPSSDLDRMGEAAAYFFTINAQGWKGFCNQLGISSGVLVQGNYDGWLLSLCEQHMPNLAPTEAELRETFGDKQFVQSDDVRKRWAQLFKQMTLRTPLELQEDHP